MADHEVLFTPFVTLHVTPAGRVVAMEVDWSDTLVNDFLAGEAIWEDGDGPESPAAQAACRYLDDPRVRRRVERALRPRRWPFR